MATNEETYAADTFDKVSMIAILTDLQTQLDGHAKVNQDKCLEIETLNNELLQCKQEICRLDTHKVKLDLENKVRQEQALVIQLRIAFAKDLDLHAIGNTPTIVLELEVKFLKQSKMVIESEKLHLNAIFEINKLRDQLQGKDTTIRNLMLSISNIMKVLNAGSTELDGLKVENVSLKRRYDELSKANTHSRMYTKSSKYIPPPKRAMGKKQPLPKKKQVTFQEPPRTSNRPTQKPPVQQNKKPNVPVNLSTRTKPATESRKPMPKSHTRNHHILPNKSVNARRAAYHNRKLNVVDHNQFVIRSLKSVNTKTPQAKHSVNHTKQVWKATRNHNVNTTKTAWRPTRKVVGSVKPQWKPTGRYFALYDNCPLTRIMEPIVEPLELTPSVSSSLSNDLMDDEKEMVVPPGYSYVNALAWFRTAPLVKCMRTRSQSRNSNRQQQQVYRAFVEPFNLEEPIENPAPPVVTMDDTRTMAQLLEAPTVGYEDAIVVPEITADNFELKHDSLNSDAGVRALLPRFSPDVAELKDMVKALLLDKKSQAPTPVKAVEESCVTCGGAHSYRNCPATNGNVYRDNIQEYVSQAAAANYNPGNTGYRAPIANQIRPPGFPPVQNNQNNQGTNQNRYNQGNNFNQNRGNNYNQNRGNNYNQGQIYQPPVNQPPVHQAPPYQAPAPQTQGVTKTDFESYVKANDAVMRNMQDQNQNLQNQMTNLTDMLSKFVNANTASSSGTGSLPSNTVTNPKEDLKGITTRSGVAYQGPTIPTTSSSPKVVECKIEVTKGTMLPTNNGSTKDHKSHAIIRVEKISLLELTPTCMTLELTDRSITQPIGIAEDVYVKVGKFQFPADFVVVDFDADPRVPLILGRSFLKTGRALIDVYKGELTLRVEKEAITFNLDQTSRYSSNYDDMTANRIDVIEMAYEDYSQEVLGFSDVTASGNPTPYDFLLEEVDAFLALDNDPTSPEVDDSYYDPEGDILLLEAYLNDDPSPLPNQGNYLPEIQKELKVCEAKTDKSSIDEPPEVKLNDLPPYLEYAFLEGDDKLPVIIAKDLSMDEKSALIKVLKSRKRAIAWKLSDIKGINLKFCTHKILMEEDYKPAVQHQRQVNPKIHDVIKKEVEKFLDAELIYPISDSP
ncbi:reverse transcriptase domain-containing protein [Tanacetum coccineum]